MNGAYINWGEPVAPAEDRAAQVAEWMTANPALTGEQIVAKFAAMSVEISPATARRYRAKAMAGKP